MDLGSLLLVLGMVILVAAFVARPLRESAASVERSPSASDDLIAQREAVLAELRDLDFDHEMGKVSDDDYAEMRARLVAKGAQTLRALDAVKAEAPRTADEEIEMAVAARRRPSAACPQCGTAARPADQFCAHCGTKLMAVAEAA